MAIDRISRRGRVNGMPVITKKEIETPLGTLETGAEAVEGCESVRAFCGIEANFPRLTECFGVDAIRRADWRIEVLDDIRSLRLFLRWRPGYAWRRHYRVGAQHFEAQQYSAGDCTVDIGSFESFVLLTDAIRHSGALPERFADYRRRLDEFLEDSASDDVDAVEEVEDIEWLLFKPEGLSVNLPALRKGETVDIAFTASWFTGEYGEGRGQTCFAADAALYGDVPWNER